MKFKVKFLFSAIVLIISNYFLSFSMSQLYHRQYRGNVLYDNDYCIKNNINCYEVVYRIVIGEEEYYICEMVKGKDQERVNYNLLDSKFNLAFENSFYSQFIKAESNSDNYWTVVLGDIKGSFLDSNLTLYLEQDILEFENDNEIIEYNLRAKKIININKKYNKDFITPPNSRIIDVLVGTDGTLYIIQNDKGKAVLNQDGKILLGYYDDITIENYIHLSYKEHEFSIREVIFNINENGNRYIKTINNKIIDKKGYIHYLGYGYYHYGFEQNDGDENPIYNIYNDKIINNRARGRYLNLFKFQNKIYFYYYAPIYDKPSGYMTIFDENGNEIKAYKKIREKFNYIYTKNGDNVEDYHGTHITHIEDDFIYAFSKDYFYILDGNMNILGSIEGKYKKLKIYGEGKYTVYALTHEIYGDDNKTDFYDSKLNLIKKDVLVTGPITTNNILNKDNKKHYIAISYCKEKFRDPRQEYIYEYDENIEKYVISKDAKLKMYDYEVTNYNKSLYVRYVQYTQRSQHDRYSIYNEKGETLLENVVLYDNNIVKNRKRNIVTGLPKKYITIYDDVSTKFLDSNLNVVKEFEGKKYIYNLSYGVNYYNDYYDTNGDKTYYMSIYDDKQNIEKVIDNNLNIIANNKEEAETLDILQD